MLCASNPLNAFSVKYGNTKGRIALPLEDLALYSRQILEALKFLHSKGLPYGNKFSVAVKFINKQLLSFRSLDHRKCFY